MHTSDIYHTQGICGFKVVNTKYVGGESIVELSPRPDRVLGCPVCASQNVRLRRDGLRLITGIPSGKGKVYFKVPVYRINCHECSSHCREELPFCHKWARHTRAVERQVIKLRKKMSIKDVAGFFGLDWRAVKDIEKRHLGIKYKRIKLKHVRIIGIDEIHIGHSYSTIVRDLISGAVLFVGEGKGGDALAPFKRKLRSSRCRIEVVAMDMSSGYSAWVKTKIESAEIVFDHFHIVQLMNKKLDGVRRQTMNKLDEEEKKKLKKKRYIFLKGQENLSDEHKVELEELKEIFEDLSTVHMMKEKLRAIYRNAKTELDARLLFQDWIKTAEEAGSACLKTMAKTLNKRLEGVLGYWKHNQITNASMEGFNNKIRWLIHQAFGYHDQEYFRLKMFDLPDCTTVKKL